MDLAAILSLMLAITILAWKPGAGFFLTMSMTLRYGFWPTLIFVFGAALGDALYFGLAASSMLIDPDVMSFITILIKSLGAAYLIWYGVTSLLNAQIEAEEQVPDRLKGQSGFSLLATGVLFTLANPLAIIFYMALIPTIVPLQEFGAVDMSIGVAVVIIWGTFSYCTLSWTAMLLGKSFMRSERAIYITNIVTSCVIILIGLVIGWSAFPLIDFEGIYFSMKDLFAQVQILTA